MASKKRKQYAAADRVAKLMQANPPALGSRFRPVKDYAQGSSLLGRLAAEVRDPVPLRFGVKPKKPKPAANKMKSETQGQRHDSIDGMKTRPTGIVTIHRLDRKGGRAACHK